MTTPMSYQILTDEDVDCVLTMADAVRKMEDALREQAAGTLVAPPRFHVDTAGGSLVFTAGAATGPENLIGFRVYDTFKGEAPDRTQLTAVFDAKTGGFRGLIVGERIGAIRTGALGGAAVKHLARPDARFAGVLGSGRQARTQVAAVAAVRQIEQVSVYSPNPGHAERFAAEIRGSLGLSASALASARQVVENADVLICATNSPQPVFDPAWLRPGTHINTLGPKLASAHELDPGVASRARVIATDSLAQVDAYPEPFFLAGADRGRMVELSAVITGQAPGRTGQDDITLFCSVGLAGTEVVLAGEVLRLAGEEKRSS